MAKRGQIAKVEGLEHGLSWKFSDGDQISITLSEIPENLHEPLAIHGLKQKGSDSYAGSKDLAEAKGSLNKVLDTLRKGLFTERLPVGEREEPIEALANAVASVTNGLRAAKGLAALPVEGVLEKLKALTPADRREYKKNPAIAAALAEAKKPKPVEELLGDLLAA